MYNTESRSIGEDFTQLHREIKKIESLAEIKKVRTRVERGGSRNFKSPRTDLTRIFSFQKVRRLSFKSGLFRGRFRFRKTFLLEDFQLL